MKKSLFFLVFLLILIGLILGSLASPFQQLLDQQSVYVEPEFEIDKARGNVVIVQTRTPKSQVWLTTTQSPPGESDSPKTAGQILANTHWKLDHAIIDGEVRGLKDYESFSFHFHSETISFSDGCNHGWIENNNDGPVYVAGDDGEFIFPYFEGEGVDANETTIRTTLIGCSITDKESGEVHEMGPPGFMPPFEDLVAYELNEGQLRLYFPEDKRNVLVFKVLDIPPTETPAPIPEMTMTSQATMPENEGPMPLPYPGSTAVTPTSVPLFPLTSYP